MSHRPSTAKRDQAAVDKKRSNIPSDVKMDRRNKKYMRSNSPGARSYAAVVSSPSPPPASQHRAVDSGDRKRSGAMTKADDLDAFSVIDMSDVEKEEAASYKADLDSSVAEITSGPDVNHPSTPKKSGQLHRHHRRVYSSDVDVSDVEMAYEPKYTRKDRKPVKKHARERSVDGYEEDSFVELVESDDAEVKKAYCHAHRVLSPRPRYQNTVENSPSPVVNDSMIADGFHQVLKNKSSRPRVPSGVKTSPIQTRASHGIYKRRLQPDAATLSEEERALQVTPKKRRRSERSKAASQSRPSPAPTHLSNDTTPPPVYKALRDVLEKKPRLEQHAYRDDHVARSPPNLSPTSTSPNLSPEKISDSKPVSISPLKLGGLDPSPEIDSPEDPKVKRRRHEIFDKTLCKRSSKSSSGELSRGRTLERGRRWRSPSAYPRYRQPSEDVSLPRTPEPMKKRKSHHNDKYTRMMRNMSPASDSLDGSDLKRDAKSKGKRKATSPSPSFPRFTTKDKGKKPATSRSIHSEIIPPPPFKPTKEEIERELQSMLDALRASREAREAELSQVNSDPNSGPSKMAGSSAAPAPDDGTPATAENQTAATKGADDAEPSTIAPVASDSSWITDFQSLHSTYVTSLPTRCEVTDKCLWDPALAADYPKLPPLQEGALLSWRNLTAVGLIGYSAWPEQTPSIDMEMLSGAMRFTKYQHWINTSRDNPTNTFVYDATGMATGGRGTLFAKLAKDPAESVQPNDTTENASKDKDADVTEDKESTEQNQKEGVNAKDPKENTKDKSPYNKTKEQLLHRSRMATCLTTILVTESQLMEPSSTGLKNKYIKGPLHTQELERMAGYLCMLFRQPALVAQFDSDHSLSFGTMGLKESKNDSNTSSKSSQSFTHIRAKGLLRAIQPTTHHQYNKSHTKAVLSATDTIPVYNAAGQKFKFPEDMENLERLPRHKGEVPLGSCVVVGYTVSVYKNAKEQLALATNLQFVIILAVD